MNQRADSSSRSSDDPQIAQTNRSRKATVRCVMASTADGKIATVDREAARFGSEEDQRRLREHVAWADALFMAAGTLRAYGGTFVVRSEEYLQQRRRSGQQPQPTSVIATRSLDLPLDLAFFAEQDIPRAIATTAAQGAAARATFDGHAEVIARGQDDIDAPAIFADLEARGMRRILLLGGGELNFACVSAGLVDELHLTISPFLYGGRASPTMLAGEGFSLDNAISLTLESVEQVDDELFLRYTIRPHGNA